MNSLSICTRIYDLQLGKRDRGDLLLGKRRRRFNLKWVIMGIYSVRKKGRRFTIDKGSIGIFTVGQKGKGKFTVEGE
jgi:hypothetical protein